MKPTYVVAVVVKQDDGTYIGTSHIVVGKRDADKLLRAYISRGLCAMTLTMEYVKNLMPSLLK